MVMKEEVKKIIVSTSPCAQLVWYSEKFLKGEWDKEECVTEWEKYRACLSLPRFDFGSLTMIFWHISAGL
ncbi:hypothetical protein MKW94_024603 [Papaver nudicaule]|uniref:Uncharacterized protein n=1 Tax=Papaver nudicaule TaxID=74823 RepID=A0AA41VYA7_PAPNU|nr:hypothetical protein [Papaver nudicaule]